MNKVTYEEFKKNNTFVMLQTEEEKQRFIKWLKFYNYPYSFHYCKTIKEQGNFYSICHSGFGAVLSRFNNSDDTLVTVYHLDFSEVDKPKFTAGDTLKCIESYNRWKKGDIIILGNRYINDAYNIHEEPKRFLHDDNQKHWKKVEVREMTMEQINKALGYNVKVVK